MAVRKIVRVEDSGGGIFVVHVDTAFSSPYLTPGSLVFAGAGNYLEYAFPNWLGDPITVTLSGTWDNCSGGGAPGSLFLYVANVSPLPWIKLVAGAGFTQAGDYALTATPGSGTLTSSFDIVSLNPPGGPPGSSVIERLEAFYSFQQIQMTGMSVATPDGQSFPLPDILPTPANVEFCDYQQFSRPPQAWLEVLIYDGPPPLGLPRGLCHVGRVLLPLAYPWDKMTLYIGGMVDNYFNGRLPRPRRWNVGFRVADPVQLIPSALFVIPSQF